jgi:hypothetical protein
MSHRFLSRAGRAGAGLVLAAIVLTGSPLRGADAPAKADGPARADAPPKPQVSAEQKAREHWESVVLFYGEEDTGEWSLRIDDKNVRDRGWFELMELWRYNREKKVWEKLPTEKIQTAIVMPKDKPSDAPEGTEILVELKQIRPGRAGIWYAKWRVDGIEGATLMRVGSTTTPPPKGKPPKGTIPITVPITLEKAEPAFIPDPRINCVAAGAAKSDAEAKPAE